MEKQEISKKVQELQILEQNLQNFVAQKQSIQMDLNETNNALNELNNSNGDVYKIVSGIMIKSTKDSLIKDLDEKKKMINLRITSIEKQESLIESNVSKLRTELNEVIKENSNDSSN